MAILIKNPDVERRARELAALTGETLTTTIDIALAMRMEHVSTKPKRRSTVAEMKVATAEFRRVAGLDKRKVDSSKVFFDDLWTPSEDLNNR